jgi:hypothetical protein
MNQLEYEIPVEEAQWDESGNDNDDTVDADGSPEDDDSTNTETSIGCSGPTIPPLPEPPRRSVRFLDTVRVKKTYCLEDFSIEQKFLCWYSKPELRSIRHENRRIVRLLQVEADIMSGTTPVWDELQQKYTPVQKRKRSLHDRGICSRGLEHMIDQEEMVDRRSRRLRALFTVCDAQGRAQCSKGCLYTEYGEPACAGNMAREYSDASSESKNIAHVMGLDDEEGVRDFLSQIEKTLVVLVPPPTPRRGETSITTPKLHLEGTLRMGRKGRIDSSADSAKRRTTFPTESRKSHMHSMVRRIFFRNTAY